MPTVHETTLEINLSCLTHNYNYIRSKITDDVMLMAVIKAYGYGSESVELAKKLTQLGANYFAVAYTKEGVALREAGITLPILVLHPQSTNFEEIIEHCLEPSIYSEYVLRAFIKTAERLGQKNYPIHLKLNTGLNRLGFIAPEMKTIFDYLDNTEAVKVKSIFSHLAATEDWKEREFTLQQLGKFRKMAFSIFEHLKYKPLLHIANTSGTINYPEAAFNMVRCGIGLYGFGNDPAIDKELKPIGTLKTIISQIHELAPGESVGYNRVFTATAKTMTATLPIGHADGINRQYGNGRAGVFIKDKYAPIIGNVCMDMLMIDITGIDCEEGDEVILFGGPQHATVFAKKGNTISYELITGISQRVKRVIIDE